MKDMSAELSQAVEVLRRALSHLSDGEVADEIQKLVLQFEEYASKKAEPELTVDLKCEVEIIVKRELSDWSTAEREWAVLHLTSAVIDGLRGCIITEKTFAEFVRYLAKHLPKLQNSPKRRLGSLWVRLICGSASLVGADLIAVLDSPAPKLATVLSVLTALYNLHKELYDVAKPS